MMMFEFGSDEKDPAERVGSAQLSIYDWLPGVGSFGGVPHCLEYSLFACMAKQSNCSGDVCE